MLKIFTFFVFFYFALFSIEGSFAYTGETEKIKTLQENQEEINELKKQETILQFQWSTFQLGNESLGEIMKTELDTDELTELEEIISSYMYNREQREKELKDFIESGEDISEIKIELLEGKQEFYKNLIPFIQVNKLEAFKTYIDGDLSYNEKSKEIQTKIEQKDLEQNERIEDLYDNADDHAKDLRKKIERVIKEKVSSKLDIFVVQEDFLNLSNEIKIEVFEKMVVKFEDAIDNLETTENPTRVLEERIIGLEVVVEILDSYIKGWK